MGIKSNYLEIISGEKEEIPNQFLDQLFALRQQHEEEVFPFLPPSLEFYKASWKIPNISSEQSMWFLAINEENLVVGFGATSWNIEYDNLDRAHFAIYVAEPFRRKKYATAILKEIVEKLPSQITKLGVSSFEHIDGYLFLKKLKEEYQYIENVLIANLSEFNPIEIEQEAIRQKTKAEKEGYELIFIDRVKYGDYLDYSDFVKAIEAIWNDMPRENLSDEDTKLTTERHQEIYENHQLKGARYFTFVAIHKESKQAVGLTKTCVYQYQPWVSWQDDTGIIKEHRGHGLGLALKYQMLDKLLKETEAEYWFTGSNHENIYMIKINKALNHKEWTKEYVFEFDREYLSEKLLKLEE